jgi:hypothetical protein
MDHFDYVKQKTIELISTAQGIISGELHLIEGIRKINALRFAIDDSENPIFIAIRAIESETDHFPTMGTPSQYSQEYSDNIHIEENEYIESVKEEVQGICRDIISKYSIDTTGEPKA